MRDRDDAGAAPQAHRRLEPDDAVDRGGADDRPSRLGADGDRGEIGGSRGPGAGARSAGRAIQRIGIAALAAARAPSARGIHAAPVGPLAHVGLRQQDRSGFSQLLRDERVPRGNRALQRQRARGGGHPIVRVDVVLERDGDAVQRAADLAGLAFGIELVGDLEGLGVGLDDCPQLRSLAVQGLDSRQVQLGDGSRGARPGTHCCLQVVNRRLVELERLVARHGRRGRGGRDRGPGAGGLAGDQANASERRASKKTSTVHARFSTAPPVNSVLLSGRPDRDVRQARSDHVTSRGTRLDTRSGSSSGRS